MPTFNELRIDMENRPLTVEKWNGLVNEIERYKTNIFLDESNGNVGIGVNTPRAPLHIVDARKPLSRVSSAENGLMLGSDGASSYKWIQSYGGPLTINLMGNNVGIATETPQSTLHVVGDITTNWGLRFNHFTANWGANKSRPWLRKAWNDTLGDYLSLTATGNGSNSERASLLLCHKGGILFGKGHNEADRLSKELMRIDASGNLGIGTSSPAGALHIVKSSTPPAGLNPDQNGLLLGTHSVNSYKWIQSYGGPLSLNLKGNNVGIGLDSPQAKLHVKGGAIFNGSLQIDHNQRIIIGPWRIYQTGGGNTTSYLHIDRQSNNMVKRLFRMDWDGNIVARGSVTREDLGTYNA